MLKNTVLQLSSIEVQHLVNTLEDCYAEFEELMKEEEWFVTEVVDRILTALEILNKEPTHV